MADSVIRNLYKKDVVGSLTCSRDKNVVNISGYTSSELTTSGITIPELYRPNNTIVFTGKAFRNNSDTWSQPFQIEKNGLFTARTQDNNSSVSVTWWGINVAYVV